jgi:hypothetical protein
VVSIFENLGGEPFRIEHVSEPELLSRFERATDSMQKSFAGLMLQYLGGDALDMKPVVDTFGIKKLTTVDEYARTVLGK